MDKKHINIKNLGIYKVSLILTNRRFYPFIPIKKVQHLKVSDQCISNGAGNEDRTRIFALARRHNSHYTIPA